MKKIELLSPAGNMETLVQAINNGADAVYVGGERFSARAFAKNFNNDNLKEAVKYCHVYGVKIYVAVNTIIFEKEIEDFLEYIQYLYEINVDAVIMQDIGMINIVHEKFPNLVIHSSTQVNCHNDECLSFLKEIGVKRAVLAREMDIKQVKKLKTKIGLEVFIHGALCVSYSGRCLFSSLNGGRSGNRGKCVGSCRLPYELYENGKKTDIKFPLSTRELCTAFNIEELLKSNVTSLKIEGRMKSPEYVGYVTKVYRRLIDDYYKGIKPIIKKNEIVNLLKLFNRKFTSGYLFNGDIYNTKTSNHLGYPLGHVVKITKKKIYIKLTDDLNIEDGIRFVNSNTGMIVNKIYNENGLLSNHINKGNIAIIDNKVKLIIKDDVNKTIDKKLLAEIRNVSQKKIKIDFNVMATIDRPLKISVYDGINMIEKEGDILSKAINRPTTKEEIVEKISKLGNTPFKVNSINIKLDKVFIPLKLLNELRHDLINSLIEKRTISNNKVIYTYRRDKINNFDNQLNVLVRSEKQLMCIKDYANIIYTEDYDLYKKYKQLNIYYRLPSIMNDFPNYKNERLLINDLGSLNRYYKDNEIITDYTLNISNSESVKLLQKYNVKLVTISPEIPDYEILKYTNNTEIVVYGKLELMILKNFYNKNNLILKDKLGKLYPIINGKYTKILHNKNIDITNDIKTNKRIQLYDENDDNILKIVKKRI